MATIAPPKGAKPPDKGSFPLDHGGECKPQMKAFITCLKEHDSDHLPCKTLSKRYLECRMERNLMAKEELDKLGFATDEEYERIRKSAEVQEGKKEGESNEESVSTKLENDFAKLECDLQGNLWGILNRLTRLW